MTFKVKLLVSMVSARASYSPGDAFPAGDEAEANRLVAAGYAEHYGADELKAIEARQAKADKAKKDAAKAVAAAEKAMEQAAPMPEDGAEKVETAVQAPPQETA